MSEALMVTYEIKFKLLKKVIGIHSLGSCVVEIIWSYSLLVLEVLLKDRK